MQGTKTDNTNRNEDDYDSINMEKQKENPSETKGFSQKSDQRLPAGHQRCLAGTTEHQRTRSH